jgi:hypothetical protein
VAADDCYPAHQRRTHIVCHLNTVLLILSRSDSSIPHRLHTASRVHIQAASTQPLARPNDYFYQHDSSVQNVTNHRELATFLRPHHPTHLLVRCRETGFLYLALRPSTVRSRRRTTLLRRHRVKQKTTRCETLHPTACPRPIEYRASRNPKKTYNGTRFETRLYPVSGQANLTANPRHLSTASS